MKYNSLDVIEKDLAMKELSSGIPDRMSRALLSLVLHENDFDWLLRLCMKYLDYEDINVQATAILSLSHLARLHRKMDRQLVLPKLNYLKNIKELSGRVEDALDDIEMFA